MKYRVTKTFSYEFMNATNYCIPEDELILVSETKIYKTFVTTGEYRRTVKIFEENFDAVEPQAL